MRERADLGWLPQWEGPIKGWAHGFIIKNRWRCDPAFDVDDLMQDAFLLYMKLVDRYPGVRTPQHFMSLFKTALHNEIHNYARQMKARKEVVVAPCIQAAEAVAEVPEYTNFGYVLAVLNEAPEELKMALTVLTDSEKRALLTSKPRRGRFTRKSLVPRENFNAKLSRLAGLDCNYDVVTALRRLLT